jgi:catechol 2,3-dioxygenase-like lactoylglutathione lyase family enzyme
MTDSDKAWRLPTGCTDLLRPPLTRKGHMYLHPIIIVSLAVMVTACGIPTSESTGAYMENTPVLRVARPSDNLEELLLFYQDGLGFDVVDRFENHEGFDGVMLGKVGAPYHFEFTRAHGHPAGRAPTRDNLLVFYIPDRREWERSVQRMRNAGFEPVPSFNPYWDRDGHTFEDPDGYRVVLQNAAWDGEDDSTDEP